MRVAGRSYRIGVIRGDGIGPVLIDAALGAVAELGRRHGFQLDLQFLDGGADAYRRTGSALSDAALHTVRTCHATLKGPVGLPDVRLPDGTEAGLLGGILRNGLDLYANVRPVRLYPGAPSALRPRPGDIDYVIVRENTEGLYASRGRGIGNDTAVADVLLITRPGAERVVRYAFELARRRRPAGDGRAARVTCVDKSNVLRSMYLFRSVFLEVAAEYPDVQADCMYVDAAAQALVMQPERFDVLVTESMFGDILSDLGGGTVGGVAFCAGGNIGDDCAYFEPIHGSAPQLAGRDLANPISAILAAAMMLDHIGEPDAAQTLRTAVQKALHDGAARIAADGTAADGTRAIAAAIAQRCAPEPG
ncbi:MAG TPA: isocitrate/isopropylmalate dehydrogenase family protein [Nakamurella sp.]|nr:isocitrate/isopropylmalate dehydrogenase family protein [Nakamurella sp.]